MVFLDDKLENGLLEKKRQLKTVRKQQIDPDDAQ
jgi:hypothetical protein